MSKTGECITFIYFTIWVVESVNVEPADRESTVRDLASVDWGLLGVGLGPRTNPLRISGQTYVKVLL